MGRSFYRLALLGYTLAVFVGGSIHEASARAPKTGKAREIGDALFDLHFNANSAMRTQAFAELGIAIAQMAPELASDIEKFLPGGNPRNVGLSFPLELWKYLMRASEPARTAATDHLFQWIAAGAFREGTETLPLSLAIGALAHYYVEAGMRAEAELKYLNQAYLDFILAPPMVPGRAVRDRYLIRALAQANSAREEWGFECQGKGKKKQCWDDAWIFAELTAMCRADRARTPINSRMCDLLIVNAWKPGRDPAHILGAESSRALISGAGPAVQVLGSIAVGEALAQNPHELGVYVSGRAEEPQAGEVNPLQATYAFYTAAAWAETAGKNPDANATGGVQAYFRRAVQFMGGPEKIETLARECKVPVTPHAFSAFAAYLSGDDRSIADAVGARVDECWNSESGGKAIPAIVGDFRFNHAPPPPSISRNLTQERWLGVLARALRDLANAFSIAEIDRAADEYSALSAVLLKSALTPEQAEDAKTALTEFMAVLLGDAPAMALVNAWTTGDCTDPICPDAVLTIEVDAPCTTRFDGDSAVRRAGSFTQGCREAGASAGCVRAYLPRKPFTLEVNNVRKGTWLNIPISLPHGDKEKDIGKTLVITLSSCTEVESI